MTDRPIIFSGPMVRGLLDGRKTQTRGLAASPLRRAKVGDRLYVQEAWRAAYGVDWYREDLGRCPKPSEYPTSTAVEYLVDGEHELAGPSHPPRHMPRWASRLTLIVERVRLQPLTAITDGDAIAEGLSLKNPEFDGGTWQVPGLGVFGSSPAFVFRALWNSLHTEEGERWEDNPEIVALTFRVMRENIDRIAA
jgi:hypothetical protein